MHGVTRRLHHICIVLCIIINTRHAHVPETIAKSLWQCACYIMPCKHAVACSMHASVEIMGCQEQLKSRTAAGCWHKNNTTGMTK
ncbi:hypothetical protein GQ55_7G142600 [Panicum hallii var. hallii]|uniref:SWIM-type domain-containing protein n=1 Tax=Panicum hallii var. hallii TaxID=1504633 RepID=A0A2T7CV93_9POAL|nr:hypothetical protein GQ55_7G142600 [Panicum hallii var. hallii]